MRTGSKERAAQILRSLQVLVLESHLSRDITLFLCGGASRQQARFRVLLGRQLVLTKSRYVYSVYFPETLFTDLIHGHGAVDLLSLENLLAKSVNVVVIPLESPGTFAELGAFSNHDELRNKLIVVVNERYKKARSFINQGPIRSLDRDTRSRIIYSSLEESEIDQLSYRIAQIARDMVKSAPMPKTLTNPLQAMTYYLSVVYLFDPISIRAFRELVMLHNTLGPTDLATETILTSVINHPSVRLRWPEQLSFSEDGFEDYLRSKGLNTVQIRSTRHRLSQLRVQALDLYYRHDGLFLGGEGYHP